MKQISDLADQKHYLNDVATDVEPCDDKRLTNVMPFIPMDGGSLSKEAVKNTAYFFRGSDPVKLQFTAYGD